MTIQQAADCITQAFRSGKRLYLCGNGGSAADAQHLAAEFSGRFYTDRKALPANLAARDTLPMPVWTARLDLKLPA